MAMQQNAVIFCYDDRTFRVAKKGDEICLRKGGVLVVRVGLLHVQPPQTNANLLVLGQNDVYAGTSTPNEMIWRRSTDIPGTNNLKEHGLDITNGNQSQVDFGSRADEVGDFMDVSMRTNQEDEVMNVDAEDKMRDIRIGPNLDLTNPVDGTY